MQNTGDPTAQLTWTDNTILLLGQTFSTAFLFVPGQPGPNIPRFEGSVGGGFVFQGGDSCLSSANVKPSNRWRSRIMNNEASLKAKF
jgi:hypothetical protein